MLGGPEQKATKRTKGACASFPSLSSVDSRVRSTVGRGFVFRVFRVFRGYIFRRGSMAGLSLRVRSYWNFELMNVGLPNAAPNRRLRLGRVPWSFGMFQSQGSAVGEFCRSEVFVDVPLHNAT